MGLCGRKENAFTAKTQTGGIATFRAPLSIHRRLLFKHTKRPACESIAQSTQRPDQDGYDSGEPPLDSLARRTQPRLKGLASIEARLSPKISDGQASVLWSKQFWKDRKRTALASN